MASMTCHYYSSTLKRNIALNVIVPTPTSNEQIVDENTQKQYGYESGLPVVYLLHGAYGDFSSWIRFRFSVSMLLKAICSVCSVSSDGSYHSFPEK